ncbi:MAG: MBL fold metallo-hydrolase [Kiritimatiellae bacterium]|nr:MBL fold metallo-hydrolase [Kiritimatiellia bacterium]
MKVVPLASSSSGNAYLVETAGSAVLVDCGICYKRLKDVAVDAVLVTHSHSDHISGLKTLLKHREIPVYANVMTAEAVAHECGLDDSAFVCFENGQEFEVGAFTASAFSVPHDTSDPVGYLLRAGGETYFHGTDIGTPLDSIGLKLAEATIATLESNHDPVMLRTSGRPPYLVQRIAGPRGHLSNGQACELVRKFASPRLKKLYLAHLSRQCNSEHLAICSMRETLQEIGRADIELEVAG